MQPEVQIKKGFTITPQNYYVYVHVKEDDGTVFYVGKGTKLRWCVSNSRTLHWKNTANKHGVICHIVAHNLTAEEALILEKKLIASYGRQDQKTGCLVNLTDGGDGVVNYVWTEEHRKKISEAGMGKRHTPETKEKIRQANVGRTFSDQTLKLMSDARKGKPLSEKQKQSLLNRGNKRSRKIICVETGVVYDSLTLAGKPLGLQATDISKVCKGKRKSLKGFSWKYFDDQMNSENAA